MEYLSHHVRFEMWLALYKFPILLSAIEAEIRPNISENIYSLLSVYRTFSLRMRSSRVYFSQRQFTNHEARMNFHSLKNSWFYYRNIWGNIIRLFSLNVWPLKLWKHINIWRKLAKKRKNNVYKNGDFWRFLIINISKLCHSIIIFFSCWVTCNSPAFVWDYICVTYIFLR